MYLALGHPELVAEQTGGAEELVHLREEHGVVDGTWQHDVSEMSRTGKVIQRASRAAMCEWDVEQ